MSCWIESWRPAFADPPGLALPAPAKPVYLVVRHYSPESAIVTGGYSRPRQASIETYEPVIEVLRCMDSECPPAFGT